MITNVTANISIIVGHQSNENTLLAFRVHNNHSKTQQLKSQIAGTSGVTPNANQVWAYSEGQTKDAVKEKLEGLGFFGSPETYTSGNGAWACVDLDDLREQGMPVPPVEELPFVNTTLAGNSHIEFKVSSGSNFDTAVQLQQGEGFAAVSSFLSNLNININLHGDGNTLESGLGVASEIVGVRKAGDLKTLFGALNEVDVSLKFASWRDLPAETQELLKTDELKNIINAEMASMLAVLSELFEHDFRVVFIVNDSVHIEIEIRAPGLTNFAMFLMDN